MSFTEHTVNNEDLYHIGKYYGVNWRFIGHLNNLENLNTVSNGQTILVPKAPGSLNALVDALNTWYESRDKSDVAALSVDLESFARNSDLTADQVKEWAETNKIPAAEGIVWEYYEAKKLTTLSWFVGSFPGEWKKHLNSDTK